MIDEGRPYTRQAAVGERADSAALIAGPLRQGSLEGVSINFRHSDLPETEWEPLPWWYVWSDNPGSASIIFPSEAAGGLAKLRKAKRLPDLPAVFARPQDKITIERVDWDDPQTPFRHKHDRHVRFANLRIERPTGEVLHPPKPLAFFGLLRLAPPDLLQELERMTARVLEITGWTRFPDIEERIGVEDRAHYSLLEMTHATHRDLAKLIDRFSEDFGTRCALKLLVNEALAMGYALGKLEARPAERFGTGAARGIEAGAAATRNDPWRDEAARFWAEHPDWTLYAVANAIKADTDDSQNSIERAIAHLCPPSSASYGKVRCTKARERMK